MTRLTAGVTIWSVESWTAAQWAEIPEADRPADAKPVRGGWSRIVPCEDSSPASYAVAEEPPPAVAELVAEVQAEPSPPPVEDGPRDLADLATAYRAANRAACHAMKATCVAEEQASDRNHDEKRTAHERDRAERHLVEALLDRFGGIPSIDRWWQPETPLATVEADGIVFALVPHHEDAPDTREQCIQRCRVVMIPSRVETETPEQAARLDRLAAARGNRWTAAGDLEPIPVEPPAPDPAALARIDGMLRGNVVRAIRRWEAARRAVDAAHALPMPPGPLDPATGVIDETWRDHHDALREVEADARQLEGLLGTAILRRVVGYPDPTRLGPELDGVRLRAAAVRHGGIVYVAASDPVPALDDDGGDSTPALIVVRLEADRLVDLD